MRIGRTVNNNFTLVNHLTVVNQNVLILRNKEFVILTLCVSNDQTLFALGFLTESNGTACLGKNTCVLRRTSFEEFGNTRQTAVMSRVFWLSVGILASTSPTLASSPS